MSKAVGIYLHVPFCGGKCPYCDFYSRRGSGEDYDRFLAAAVRAIEAAPVSGEVSADTVYFGGGTPVLLGARRLNRLLSAVQKRFGAAQREITVEANPCAVGPEMLEELRAGGFTRISFGVQSLFEPPLPTLGRKHDAARAIEALREAARAGFAHISADLMLAVPGQTAEEIERSVDLLAAEPIDHLSAYLLKLEPGTAFAERFDEPDEDFAAACYLAMARRSESHGFSQYEISNFARNSAAQSLHNLRYWRCGEYLGIGPAAHSFWNGRRFYFPRDLRSFLDAPDVWRLTVGDGPGGDEEERVMLGLRLAEGIALDSLSDECRTAVERAARRLDGSGLLRWEKGRIALTREGFLVSNAVIAALLG